jgi:predicted nucleotidyltransferase
MNFIIPTSNDSQLNAARKLAEKYINELSKENIVGVAFLGAIVRGYYDDDSDIDITVFRNKYEPLITSNTFDYDNFKLHIFEVDYNNELSSKWEMGKRWAYSSSEVHYDNNNLVKNLIKQKVPLGIEEKKWLVMSGITLAEWYFNRLTDLWIRRGDIENAHYQINEGLNHFFNVLFAINNELVPDHKWRIYCSKKLNILPNSYFQEINNIQIVQSMNMEELKRRKNAFSIMWNELLPIVEEYLGMKYIEFKDTV